MTAQNAVPVVYIIGEPHAIGRLAKIVREVFRTEPKTIYGVFKGFGRESMEKQARRLARVKPDPDLIVSAVGDREKDSDIIVGMLRANLNNRAIVYAKAYARPGGHWLIKPEGEKNLDPIDPLIKQLRRAA